MAVVEITLATADDGGPLGAWHGDAFARTHPTLDWPWNSTDEIDFLGTDNKAANPENVLFLRYRVKDAWPKGAKLLHAQFIFRVTFGGVTIDGPEGKFRLGQLIDDGVWNDPAATGWNPGVGAGEYPSSLALPFPTDPSSDVIKIDKITFNDFLGTVSYDLTDDGTFMTVGDEGYLPIKEFPGNIIALFLQIQGPGGFDNEWAAYVVDPFEVPAANPEFITLLTDDSLVVGPPKGRFGVKLQITYDEQPPTITSAPGLGVGSPGVLYDYGPLTADDPLPGDPATVTFALVDPEDGMTVINDGGTWRFDWTPSLTAPAVYTVKLQATDEDGFTSAIQSWIVVIQPDGKPGEVCVDLEIFEAVGGGIVVSEGVVGSVEVEVAVSGTLEIPPAIEGELDVAPVVGGTLEVKKCP